MEVEALIGASSLVGNDDSSGWIVDDASEAADSMCLERAVVGDETLTVAQG